MSPCELWLWIGERNIDIINPNNYGMVNTIMCQKTRAYNKWLPNSLSINGHLMIVICQFQFHAPWPLWLISGHLKT